MSELFLGDCLDYMKTMPDKSVDAIITDPPFGIGFKYHKKEENNNPKDYWKWFNPIYKQIQKKVKDGGFIAIWQTNKYFPYFWKWFGNDIRIYASCKNFVQLRKTAINYGFDPIILKYKKGLELLKPINPKRNIDWFVCNTAKFVTEKDSLTRQHPCPRPIDQVCELIDNFVIEDGLVFDPFMGSGTTGVASLKLQRKFVGCEINKDYFEIAKKRIGDWEKQSRLFEGEKK